jgi:hypothetical protein
VVSRKQEEVLQHHRHSVRSWTTVQVTCEIQLVVNKILNRGMRGNRLCWVLQPRSFWPIDVDLLDNEHSASMIQYFNVKDFRDKHIRISQRKTWKVKRIKKDSGTWEHAVKGYQQRTFRPVVPPPHRVGGVRCSVARLTRYPPLQHPCNPTPPDGFLWWLHVWSGQALYTPTLATSWCIISTPSIPRSGYRWPLHHPDERLPPWWTLYT